MFSFSSVLHLLKVILFLQVEDYIAPRFSHKRKSKLRQKILEAHSNVKDLNLIEAKMNFIKAWQSLPEFGTSLFVVKFHGERREELVGIAFNRFLSVKVTESVARWRRLTVCIFARLMRMVLGTGDHITTWRYSQVKVWRDHRRRRKHLAPKLPRLNEFNVSLKCFRTGWGRPRCKQTLPQIASPFSKNQTKN